MRVVYLVNHHRGKSNGCVYFISKDSSLSIAFVRVDEHARDDAVAVEGLAVGGVGVGLACVGGVEPSILGQFGFGLFFELAGVGVEEGCFACVALPEVVPLVERVLGCFAHFLVFVFGIHGGGLVC